MTRELKPRVAPWPPTSTCLTTRLDSTRAKNRRVQIALSYSSMALLVDLPPEVRFSLLTPHSPR